MTRPENIPEDVWWLAIKYGGTSMSTQADRLIIANAIMADRAARLSAAGLTTKQHELLNMIAAYQAQHGQTPSFAEMRDAMGLASSSGIHRLIHGLEERGRIKRLPNRSRAITIIANPAN